MREMDGIIECLLIFKVIGCNVVVFMVYFSSPNGFYGRL